MNDGIHIFLEAYFVENGLYRSDEAVQYVPFLLTDEQADEDFINLLAGKKRASYRVKKWFTDQNLNQPKAGYIWVFTDLHGLPQAVMKIKSTETIAYGAMTQNISQAIGLGDGSVATWRVKSRKFIQSECETLNIDFNDDTEILISWYDTLYPESAISY